MKRFYTYSPKKKSSRLSQFNAKEQAYIKTIIRSFIAYILIIAISFFGFIAIFSNINNLWSFIKGKEVYVEENNIGIGKPFLSTHDEFTKENNVSFEGIAEAGKKVILFKNNKEEANTIANNENKYNFNDIEINTNDGAKTSFYTIVKDEKGKESAKSNEVTITFDKTKPKLEVKSPENDQKVKSFSRTLEVTGSTEPDTQVLVNDRITRINLNNEFSATIRLEDGENIVTIIAKDKAGNETKSERKVIYEKP